MTTTKRERDDARAVLLELIPPGTTVHTILRHVSRSGMSRIITPVLLEHDPERGPWSLYPGWNIARACGYHYDDRREGIRIGGCGMDMGFALVYDLSRALYPDGFACLGAGNRCPSNDHSNGRPVRKGTWHTDGGYALRHAWL
jgi:hypothetical protein